MRPPWGILTGVRPAKVASDLMYRQGMGADDAVRFLSDTYLLTGAKAQTAVRVAECEHRIITPESVNDCSLYIGIPFCPTRCAYCSFVSYTTPRLLSMIPAYLEALKTDIGKTVALIKELGLRLSTVYIGGGTPTVLDEDQLSGLLGHIASVIPPVGEFTLESGRPDTITAEKLRIAADHGVTRISVNPQTLNDDVLRTIGRAHDTAMFYSAYETAVRSGIRDINVDIIAGLPGDTEESFRNTVDGIISLGPSNITVHTFSVKKASVFRTEGKYDPSSALAGACVDYSASALQNAGYGPYYMYRQKNTVGNLENVGYSMPGREGLYNIYMMEEVHSVFAAGASSVTKLVSAPDSDGHVRIERLFQPKYPYEYMDEHSGGATERTESIRRRALEFFGKKG